MCGQRGAKQNYVAQQNTIKWGSGIEWALRVMDDLNFTMITSASGICVAFPVDSFAVVHLELGVSLQYYVETFVKLQHRVTFMEYNLRECLKILLPRA
ncbi:hypothetical protein HZH68_010701 [Vespula germanica]|uniref:Uncharacterized protein n=1 Tax=Vespula germanica TaxID=30212 RepID=A0A834JUL0_VESGE|nr:hypothetical protein HZH68_010701 [Vespula germanica]